MPFPLRSAALGPFPPLPIHRRCRRLHTIAAITAPPSFSLHHHRNHSHRKNHLRAKLPQIPIPAPTPTSLHPCPPPIQEDRAPDETFGDERGEEDRGATEEEYSLLSEIKAPERTVESGTAGFNISKVLVNLSMCLTVVVVVRTVVWAVAALRGGDGVQERKKDGRVVRELKLLPMEDERKVEEIRALAKRARGEEEAMVGDGAGEAIIRNSVMEEIERRAERMKMKMGSEFQKKTEEDGEKMKMKMKIRELQKKVGDGDVAVGTRKSEGNNVRRKLAFRKMKVDIANRDRIKGFDGSEWRNQKVSNEVLPHLNDLENTMLKESLDTSVLPSKNSEDINNLDASVPDSNERSRSGHGVSVSGGTGKKDNAKEADALITQSRNTNTELRSSTGAKERSGCKQLWWLKLPYVLCIFLRTGSEIDVDPDDPMKGLYAMKMDPYSDDSPSHVIVFEDHTDARNLCYLLESHFEVLGDFSTDIVPLPIKELEDVVMTNSLNVVVVKKAELRLYAGQPLLEVETAIRSIIRRNDDKW